MAAYMRRCTGILKDFPVNIYIRRLGRYTTSAKRLQASDTQNESPDTRGMSPLSAESSPTSNEQTTSIKNKYRNRNHPEYLKAPPEYRFIYPEFLPDLGPDMRHPVREKLERMDMLRRRKAIQIPEFYVGSIIAVTATDRCAPGKQNRFLGICIHRTGHGLRATFTLRNVVDHQGVEIMYELYNPTIQKIDVIRLEKRLDNELFYLRDAYPEYSTFPFDMEKVPQVDDQAVPVNPIKVKLKPRPWSERWYMLNLQGIEDLILPERFFERARRNSKPWEKYDLMKQYRSLIPEEEQQEIYSDVYEQEKQHEKIHKITKRSILPPMTKKTLH